MQYWTTLITGASLLQSVLAQNYELVDDYQGGNFLNKMNWFTSGDPTDGYVTYVSESTAESTGMYSLSNNIVYLGVDHTNVASGSGRNSIRVQSNNAYTHMLVVIDLTHMPGGICGTWPAFWTVGPNWPNDGEIDIVEGVNSQNVNYMTLHAGVCSISNGGDGLLSPYSTDCNAEDNGNAGCSFHETNDLSYGNAMNNNGGAQYAMEWTSEGVSIWWWNAKNPAPSDMFGSNPNPRNWGAPSANWAGSGCNWESEFQDHQLVFDTTFCGQWAGQVWGSDSTCAPLASSCDAYVQNNPSAFDNAYWGIADLKVYQNNGQNNNRRAVNVTEQLVDKRAGRPQVAPSLVPEADRLAGAAVKATDAPVARSLPPPKVARQAMAARALRA